MQISSTNITYFVSARGSSKNAAAKLMNELSNKTLYLTNEKEFDNTINQMVQLNQSNSENKKFESEGLNGVGLKTGDTLGWMLNGYNIIDYNLKYAEDEVNNGTYGYKAPDWFKDIDKMPKNVEEVKDVDVKLDNSKTVELSGEIYKRPSDEELFKGLQNSLSSFVTGFGNFGINYKNSLYNGFMPDGAQVTDKITKLVKQSLPNGNDDWMNLSAKSLGLDKTFDNTRDYVSALENARNTVKACCDAISSVKSTLPKSDFFDWASFLGGRLDTTA